LEPCGLRTLQATDFSCVSIFGNVLGQRSDCTTTPRIDHSLIISASSLHDEDIAVLSTVIIFAPVLNFISSIVPFSSIHQWLPRPFPTRLRRRSLQHASPPDSSTLHSFRICSNSTRVRRLNWGDCRRRGCTNNIQWSPSASPDRNRWGEV